MMSEDQILSVVQAHKDGKKIQWKYLDKGDWNDLIEVGWNFVEFLYRVKPIAREWWIAADSRGNPAIMNHPPPSPEIGSFDWAHVREIIE